MKVNLVTNDGETDLATVNIPDFPSHPDIIVWTDKYGIQRAFEREFSYGHAPETYEEKSLYIIPPKSDV